MLMLLLKNIFYAAINLLKNHCTVGQKKKKKPKHRYLFQYKLSYKNETGTNHYGLLSTSV